MSLFWILVLSLAALVYAAGVILAATCAAIVGDDHPILLGFAWPVVVVPAAVMIILDIIDGWRPARRRTQPETTELGAHG